MKIEEVKRNLNKIVTYSNRDIQQGKYKLTGCIIRRAGNKFYYQAELKDLKAESLIIASLENVNALEEQQ